MLIKTDANRVPIEAEDRHQSQQHQTIQQQSAHERRETATVAAAGDGMDVTNPGARMGRPLSAWTIRERLQKIREFLVFERSNAMPTQTGIYIRAPKYDPALYKGHLIFVCGMESGQRNGSEYMIPEFSIKVPKLVAIPDPEAPGGQRMIPTMDCEIRGWRSVLAALLKWGIISAHDIEKHFHVSMGRDSQHWQELLDPNIEVATVQTEEIYGRADTETGDQGASGDDTGGLGASDGGRAGAESLGGVLDGASDADDQGNAQARRRDASEEGRGRGAPSGEHAPDDCSSGSRARSDQAAAVQL